MKALVVDEPWIGLILQGKKTWEMRSRRTHHRGMAALIRKGSGRVVGITHVIGCHGPLSADVLATNAARHRVPAEVFRSGSSVAWNIAWELDRSAALPFPVPYAHPLGAVVWVDLDESATAQILMQVADLHLPCSNSERPCMRGEAPPVVGGVQQTWPEGLQVPVAKDGTWFGPHLLKAGEYTIGAKGEEFRCDDFISAMEALRTMPVARWRRPNPSGNWSIVSAVRWMGFDECEQAADRDRTR